MANDTAYIFIDHQEIRAKKSDNLLWVALENGFYIPNLCSIKKANPIASCRLCFVEIAGKDSPTTACTQKVIDGMEIFLNTKKVQKIRNTSFELLISHHRLDCGTCTRNRNCELQNIAFNLRLKLKPRRVRQIPRTLPVDISHPLFYYDPNKCVLCGKCIYVCKERGEGTIDFAFRGINARISTFAGMPFSKARCNSCLACVSICPVDALGIKPT